MKRQIVTAIAALFVAFTLSVSLHAQTAEPGIHQVNIPFAFHVENRAFAAGNYEISWLGPRLEVKSLDTKQVALVIVTRMDAEKSASRNYLKFTKYGASDYFLSEVWVLGNNFGHELQKSKLEVEIASRHEPASYAMVGLSGKK